MPVEVQERVTETSTSPSGGQVKQTEAVTDVPTHAEVQEAKAEKKNAFVWYIVGLIDAVLVLRLLFHLFGARNIGFAEMLYSFTNPLVAPFKGIFRAPLVDGSYFDTAALVALIIYTLLGVGIAELINLITRPGHTK